MRILKAIKTNKSNKSNGKSKTDVLFYQQFGNCIGVLQAIVPADNFEFIPMKKKKPFKIQFYILKLTFEINIYQEYQFELVEWFEKKMNKEINVELVEWNRWKRDKSGRFLKLEVKSVGLLEFAFSHSPEWNVFIQRQENYLDRWCWWELAIYLDQF